MLRLIENISSKVSELTGFFKERKAELKFFSSTTTGTIVSNTKKVSIINAGGANATITAGGTNYSLTPNEVITLDPGPRFYNDTITFDATGTTIKYIVYR